MGYENKFPRRKWRCYFCNFIKYGLKANLLKVAPNESQYCKIFMMANKMHWKEIASHLLNVLKEYPASKAFWYSEKRSSKEYKQKDTYPINLKKISRNIDNDLSLLNDPSADNNEPEKYPSLEDFLKDLFTVFRNTELFVEAGKRKYQYSQACQKLVMFLLEKEEIFKSVNKNLKSTLNSNLEVPESQPEAASNKDDESQEFKIVTQIENLDESSGQIDMQARLTPVKAQDNMIDHGNQYKIKEPSIEDKEQHDNLDLEAEENELLIRLQNDSD